MTAREFIRALDSRECRPSATGRGWSARCPAHEDRNPSLSIGEAVDGSVLLKCHAGCSTPAVVAALGLGLVDLFPGKFPSRAPTWLPSKPRAAEERALVLDPLDAGTDGERDRLAALRGLPREAIELAIWLKLLWFADHEFRGVETARVWVLTDSARRIAQLRRLDGRPCRWSARGSFHEAKSYTVPGSTASWPVGFAELRGDTPQVLLVEGGPDLLAACAVLSVDDRCSSVIPVAMLGGSARIAPEALALVGGCRVRLVPHADPAGRKSEGRWGNQLLPWAAAVDVFDLTDELKDGKDLNDFVRSTGPDRWREVLT